MLLLKKLDENLIHTLKFLPRKYFAADSASYYCKIINTQMIWLCFTS